MISRAFVGRIIATPPLAPEFFRQIAEAALDGVWTIDAEGVTTYANPAMAEMLGYTPSEMIDRSMMDFVPKDAVPNAERNVERRKAGVREHHKFPLVHRHGHILWVDMATSPLLHPDGGYAGALATVQDITDYHRFQAEREQLLDELAIVADVVDRAPVCIQIFDGRGCSQRMNEAMRVFLGLASTREGLGTFNCLTDPEAVASGLAARMSPAYEGQLVRHEYAVDATHLPHGQSLGGTAWIEQLVYPVQRADGSVLAVVSISQEITERKRMESTLADHQRIASLSVLAGRVAHDFNNLLAALTGNVDVALGDPSLGAAARLSIERIAELARRGTELTRPLAAFSGGENTRPEPSDLNELVREAVEIARVTFPRGAAIELALGSGCVPVMVDRDQIRRVVLNLLANAAEAISDRGRIRVRAGGLDLRTANGWRGRVEPGQYAYLEVEDDGLGIDSEMLSRIFEPFFSTKRQGQGLGLSAALGIVGTHGGAIRVESPAGRGTRFTVALPPHDGPVRTVPGEVTTRRPSQGGTRGTILFADDDDVVREVLGRLMELAGYETVAARDGLEALELYKADPRRFCAVVLDLLMPRMGGAEAYARLRALDRALPILLCSGFAASDIRVPPPDDLHARFLAKPFRRAELEEVLATLVGSSS